MSRNLPAEVQALSAIADLDDESAGFLLLLRSFFAESGEEDAKDAKILEKLY